MNIELNLLQNFLLALSFATSVGAIILILKAWFKKTPPPLQSPKDHKQLEDKIDQTLSSIATKDIQSMQESTYAFEKSYALELENLNKKLEQTTIDAIQNTQKIYNEKLAGFMDQLLKNGLSTQTMIDKKTADLMTNADQEITEYKKRRMEKIDQEVKELIDKVYRNVLKSSIPESFQQELIVKSLEDAKRDGLFKF